MSVIETTTVCDRAAEDLRREDTAFLEAIQDPEKRRQIIAILEAAGLLP